MLQDFIMDVMTNIGKQANPRYDIEGFKNHGEILPGFVKSTLRGLVVGGAVISPYVAGLSVMFGAEPEIGMYIGEVVGSGVIIADVAQFMARSYVQMSNSNNRVFNYIRSLDG